MPTEASLWGLNFLQQECEPFPSGPTLGRALLTTSSPVATVSIPVGTLESSPQQLIYDSRQ